MILPLFRRSTSADTISALYGMIVARARTPAFYRDLGVPDTVDGRFEMIVLHLVLVLRRFDRDPALRKLGQAIFDRFCRDMDHNLREIGIGDLKVPAEMRRIGAAFYGRTEAYAKGLAQGPAELAAAVGRNVFGGGSAGAAGRLATYMMEVARDLDTQDAAALARGKIRLGAVEGALE
jgi:cytochrome b pre-mRNA-processing protein 3